jgi:hypothetical protein
MDYGPVPPQMHPMVQKLLGEQQQPASPWEALMGFGLGVLGAGSSTPNWFGAGAQGAAQVMQRKPEMSALEALRASSELYELDQRRLDLRRQQAQEQQQREVKRRLIENLRAEGRHQEADLLEAELLTKDQIGEIMGIGQEEEEDAWTRFTGPDGREYAWNGDPNTEARLISGVGDAPAEVAEPIPGTEPLTRKERLTFAGQASTAYQNSTAKVFEEPLRRYRDIATKDPTKMNGPEQRTLIVNYAKMLDPTSAVMENEADAVAKAGETAPKVMEFWREYLNGGLSEARIREIMMEMEGLATRRYAELKEDYETYKNRLTGEYGVPDVTPWIGKLPEAPPPLGFTRDEETGEIRPRGTPVE